ncbi:methyltransferase [Novosphingobium pokkalii]|uniref:methyltransferase n=1 Tax=Novosphingobium pokkalii TaxID=1770194 RepID=UPI003645CA8C
MTQASDWQGGVGRAWAEEWQRTDRTFAQLTPALLAAIAAQPGATVLDIGCGAGELSLALAAARPQAHVRGGRVGRPGCRRATARGRSGPGPLRVGRCRGLG